MIPDPPNVVTASTPVLVTLIPVPLTALTTIPDPAGLASGNAVPFPKLTTPVFVIDTAPVAAVLMLRPLLVVISRTPALAIVNVSVVSSVVSVIPRPDAIVSMSLPPGSATKLFCPATAISLKYSESTRLPPIV